MRGTSPEYWKLVGTVGELSCGDMVGHVDVAHPQSGLRLLKLSGHPLDGLVFVLTSYAKDRDSRYVTAETDKSDVRNRNPHWPLDIADAYVRDRDLVATYAPFDAWPYSPQIYWRAESLNSVEGVIGSISLIVSMQTHLLDTRPRLFLASMKGTETLQVTSSGGKLVGAEVIDQTTVIQPTDKECCIVRRLPGVPLSYVEIMSGSDFHEVAVRRGSDATCNVVWELFGEFLEKGVIRRSQVHGVFVRRDDDLELAAACCGAVERSPLPLTA
jgi:hypothetical protein